MRALRALHAPPLPSRLRRALARGTRGEGTGLRSRLVEALNEDSKSLKGWRVLVLGLSYKANIDDTRESPSYELIELLAEGGARVGYSDPFFPEALRTRKHDLDPRLWGRVKLVVDTRNMVGPLFGEGEPLTLALSPADAGARGPERGGRGEGTGTRARTWKARA